MKRLAGASIGYVVAVAVGIAIGTTALGIANAGGSSTLPVAVTVHHYTIAASAFAPDRIGNPSEDYSNQSAPAALSNNDGTRCFNAPVVLPNGATLKSVTFFYTRGTVGEIQAELNRQNLLTHGSFQLAVFADLGGSSVYTKKAVTITKDTKVDTSTFAYGSRVCDDDDATFTGLMVNYTV